MIFIFDKVTHDRLYEFSLGKLIICGNKLELKEYTVPIYSDERVHSVVKGSKNNDKLEYNLSRARQNVRRIVWCNITPHSKFLTLTTKDTVLDLSVIKRRFTTFIQAMKREGFKLRYLGVFERQLERGEKEGNAGSFHIHLIIFNDEYIPFEVINKHWQGMTDIRVLNGLKWNSDEHIEDIGAYVCKYVTKEACQEFGSHTYFCSVGLNRPVEIKDILYKDMSKGEWNGRDVDQRFVIDSILKNSKQTYFDIKNFEIAPGKEQYIQYSHYSTKKIGD